MDVPLCAYVIVLFVAAGVGLGELVSRYRDEPLDAVRRLPALLYVSVNGGAGVFALLVIDALDWTFGAPPGLLQGILQVSTASFSGMSVLRSAVFTVRVGDSDVHAGPVALVQIILDAADRAVDRGRAQRRSQAVQEIMDGVDFDKAKQKLPSHCVSLMQGVPPEEQKAITEEVLSLESETALGNTTRARQLGLVLMNVVGEKVLRESVKALRDEIVLDP